MKFTKMSLSLLCVGGLGLAWCLHSVTAAPAGFEDLASLTPQEAVLVIGDGGPPGTYRECKVLPGGNECVGSGNEGHGCGAGLGPCEVKCYDDAVDKFCGSSFGSLPDKCAGEGQRDCSGTILYCDTNTDTCEEDDAALDGACGRVQQCNE